MPLASCYDRPNVSSGLWGHLLRNSSSQVPLTCTTTTTTALGKHTPVMPLDKAGTSTRILLHDTQAQLEKFSDCATQLASSLSDAKQELVTMQKMYQDEHEQLVERMIGLTNRCQTELQKSMGIPAQSSDLREVSGNLHAVSTRLDALDKKMDALSMLNQTQSQALQAIQEQQCQILTALLPILPVLNSMPLRIDSARDEVKQSISELCQHLSTTRISNMPASSVTRTHTQTLAVDSDPMDSSDPATSPSQRKRRRMDTISTSLSSIPESRARRDQLPQYTGTAPKSARSLRLAIADPVSRDLSSPKIPVKMVARSSRNSAPKIPAVNLLPLNQRPATPALDPFEKISHRVEGTPGCTSELPGSSVSCTPRRAMSTRLGNEGSNSTTSPRRAGIQNLPLSSHRNTTPHSRGTLRQSTPATRTSFSSVTPRGDQRRAVTPHLSTAKAPHEGRPRSGSAEKPSTPDQVSTFNMPPPSVPTSTSKPMSLKDRRALFSDDTIRDAGKRFIPLDDEDDEEME